MSETQEQELKPCPCCGSQARLSSLLDEDDYRLFYVFCTNCAMCTDGDMDKTIVIADWNYRPAPAAQWTSETSGDGYYWLQAGDVMAIVKVVGNRMFYLSDVGTIAMLKELYITNAGIVQWLRIPEPPTPEKEATS